MIVVSDTSPLNYLHQIGLIDVLPQLYGQVYIPHEVHSELLAFGASSKLQQWAVTPPSWLQIRSASLALPEVENLDPGERAAINLAIEIQATQILVDDGQARRLLKRQFKLRVTGTLGVLIQGHSVGLLNAYSAFETLRGTTNFYCTPQIEANFIASLSEFS